MRKYLITILSCLAGVIYGYAQCAIENDAVQPGEHLVYNLKFNWKFIWVDAGKAEMTVLPTEYNGKPALRTSLLSVSNKKVDFFFKMRDTLTSITTKNIEPIYFRKGAEEGSRYTVDEAWFKYKDGESIVDLKRQHKDGTIDTNRFQSKECVFDMLSILLHARSFDPTNYIVGQKINFLMADGKKVENQTLIYRGKKNFKSEEGITYRCLVFSLVEYKKKKEKEVITFFVTDDKNHLPVRLDLYLNFGSAKAFLNKVSGNKYPLTSIVNNK